MATPQPPQQGNRHKHDSKKDSQQDTSHLQFPSPSPSIVEHFGEFLAELRSDFAIRGDKKNLLDNGALIWHSFSTPSAAPAALGHLPERFFNLRALPNSMDVAFSKGGSHWQSWFRGTAIGEPLH
jgi:hypothetical protein